MDTIFDLPPAPGFETPEAHFGLWSLGAPAAADCNPTPTSPPGSRPDQNIVFSLIPNDKNPNILLITIVT